MDEILISINKRRALVSLNKEQFDKSNNGLIQYLSHFADKIEWNILK